MFRRRDSNLQVFLVHPGGPFWKKKDAGAWSMRVQAPAITLAGLPRYSIHR